MPATPTLTRLRRRDALKLIGAGAASTMLASACSTTSSGAHPTVSWQAIPSYSLQSTDQKRLDYLHQQLIGFEGASIYGIDAQVTSGDTSAAMAKLLLQASQGRAPNIAQVDGYIFPRMSPYAQPLTDQMLTYGFQLDDWFPSLRSVMTGGGNEVRGLQFTTDVRVLYHRLDLVPNPPATWDELVDMARPLAQNGQYMLFPGGRSEGAVLTTVWPQYLGQGVELFDSTGEAAFQSGAAYAAMRDALGVVERLVKGGLSPSRVATFGSEDNANADVVAGRVAMFLGGSWQAAALNNLLPDHDFFSRWGVAPIPSLTGNTHVTSAGGWVWAAFTSDRGKIDAGMDWVSRAFLSDQGMGSWCTIGGYLPPRQSVYALPEYKQNPFTPLFRDHLSTYARTRPADRKYLEVSNSMQIALSSVAAGSTTADQALSQALSRLA